MSSRALAARIRDRFAQALARTAQSTVALRIGDRIAGRLSLARAARLAAFADVFVRTADDTLRFVPALASAVERSAALVAVTQTLAAEGALTAWRDEVYAVAPAFGAPAWFRLERAAARYFGVRTYAAHVNGLVRTGAEVAMWVARRSPTKAIDPGMLDNLVGGGIAAGVGVARTVAKESWEEAGIPAGLASRAQPTAVLHVARDIPDGIQDEVIFVHDLWLPPAFTPVNQDGEASGQHRHPLATMPALLAESFGDEAMTVDASLVALTVVARAPDLDPDARATLTALLRDVSRPL